MGIHTSAAKGGQAGTGGVLLSLYMRDPVEATKFGWGGGCSAPPAMIGIVDGWVGIGWLGLCLIIDAVFSWGMG